MAEWSQMSFSSPEILVHAEGYRFESWLWLLFLYLYSVYTNKKVSHPSSLSYVCAKCAVAPPWYKVLYYLRRLVFAPL